MDQINRVVPRTSSVQIPHIEEKEMAVHLQRMLLSENTDKHETNMNQDNPFAKGVSINQDIVQEPEMVPMIGLAVPDNLKRYHESGVQMSEDAAGLMGVGETPRIRCVDYDPTNEDRYNASLYANHPTLNRELLALGREEE